MNILSFTPSLSFSVLVSELMKVMKGALALPRIWPLFSDWLGSGDVPSNLPFGRPSITWEGVKSGVPIKVAKKLYTQLFTEV